MQFTLTCSLILILLTCTLLFSCNPNDHRPSDHPCNFPDAYTESDLRSPWTFKIISKETSENHVDTTTTALIHVDSVVLFDEPLNELPLSHRYYIDNWIFDGFVPYDRVQFHDPEALLSLAERTFYLRTAYNDLDTIKVFFEQCLVKDVLFNGVGAKEPVNDMYDGYVSFYFRK